ncbi:NUDIX hydrolase [Mesorhizobium sp. L-8-3]|uniref:NUDIX hydrolase n=1 Tax=Mesorhizobium sp. L-8-3 TaxID=2744522 RepID=UPI0019293051|nr:NUDIX hydrolase [Mesorhizobium sp. L-8-3]BCH25397.1 NUDIX hydrolase [Mesorhizobium sp. L-8-3]
MDQGVGDNLSRPARAAAGPSALQVAALPWRRNRGGIEVMLITSRDTGRWVLPKGWPEGPEEFRDAAAREAKEEAGISGAVSRIEVGHYSYLKCGASRDLSCDVLVYSLEVGVVADKWKEKGQRRRRWVKPEKAARMVNEPDLAVLIETFASSSVRIAAE